MKKIITIAAMLAFYCSNAQEKTETPTFGFAKTAIFIEGQLSVLSGKMSGSDAGVNQGEQKSSGYSFSPKGGYFFTNKLAAGVSLNSTSNKQTTREPSNVAGQPDATREDKLTGFGAEVFARYYFLKLGKRFDVYTELSAGFGAMDQKSTQQNVTESGKLNTIGANVDIGINYFVTPRIAVSFTLANVLEYNSIKISGDQDQQESKQSVFSANLNVFDNVFAQTTFGLLYEF